MAVDPSVMGGPMGSSTNVPNPSGTISAGVTQQIPYLAVTINGNAVNAMLLGASITYGFDVGIASATVDFAAANQFTGGVVTDPTHSLDNINYFDEVKIYCGADPNGPGWGALRFTGVYLSTQATMWPGVFQLVCKGNLYRAAQYYQQTIFVGQPAGFFGPNDFIGSPLVDRQNGQGNLVPGYLNGQLGVDSTDGRIVQSILELVPGLGGSIGTIDGTQFVILFSFFDATWPPYRSAWDQIQLFDQAFLGFRTYESIGGVINRSQIFGYPNDNADREFTEGIDIWEAQGTRSVETLINASFVTGMTQTAGQQAGDVFYAYVESGNPFQGSPVVEQFNSPFIEASNITDPDHNLPGLRADDVAGWRLTERNRELVNVQFTTFRDDPILIGHTYAVNIPHAAVTQPVWAQRVEIVIQNQPILWQQTIYGISGGIPGDSGSQPYNPPDTGG